MARTRGAVYGEEGTISGALKEREAHLAELMDPLKPKMDLLIAGLDLRAGIKKLLEAVDMTATSLMHTSANDIRD